jgi:hypothetical protein
MIVRSLLLLSAGVFLSHPVSAQTSRHVLKGDSVAVYNLVGELRVEAGSGSDVVVEVQRGGDDSAKLEILTGPIRGRETLRIIYPDDVIVMPDWGRGWNTTLRVRDDGTFGDDGDGHGRGWSRDGREVRITGRSRSGLEAYADLRVTVPKGKTISLNVGVGKAFVSNVEGNIRVSVASADVADRTRYAAHRDGSGMSICAPRRCAARDRVGRPHRVGRPGHEPAARDRLRERDDHRRKGEHASRRDWFGVYRSDGVIGRRCVV